jgi:hypothetical protein
MGLVHTMTALEATEIVLPTGAFARFRPPTGVDFNIMVRRNREGKEEIITLLVLCVTLDDVPLTYEALDKMPLCDVNAMAGHMCKYLTGKLGK